MSYEYVAINNEIELFNLIEEYLEEPLNNKKTLLEITQMIGLSDTLTLLDERTVLLIKKLDYYDNNISPPAYELQKYPIWVECVEIYSRLKPRMF